MPNAPALHVLIADDEQHVQDHLASLLSTRPVVGSISVTASPQATLDAFNSAPPDLIFLSTQFSTTSGLSIAEEIAPDLTPPTIFISADDAFAAKAFDLNAVDYLLRPFDPDRFGRAFERALRAIRLQQIEKLGLQFRDLPGGLDRPPVAPGNGHIRNGYEPSPDSATFTEKYLRRVVVEGQNQLQIGPVDDIR